MNAYTIENARCEYQVNPLGVDAARPRLTWAYYGDNPDCLGAEIRVTAAADPEFRSILWDSGWERSDLTAMDCALPERVSGQRVWWTARTRLEGRPETEAVSEKCWFETGLLEPGDWHGDWIRADTDFDAPVLCRSFRLERLPQRARAYVCGLGLFELVVNGTIVGDEVLQPVMTAYSRQPQTHMNYPYVYGGAFRTPYRTFDLAGTLKAGENRIEVHLGNGWYCQRGRLAEGDLWYGDAPALRMELRLDGRAIATDLSWQWREGAVVRNNLFYGEEADFTRPAGALRPVIRAKAPDGPLCAQACPSDAAVGEYPVRRALESSGGGLILDFAQNLSGWEVLEARARRGDRVELRFAEEILPDGGAWRLDFASAGGERQIQADAFTLAGTGAERVHPRFCWHGFRYAEIRLFRNGGELPLAFSGGRLTAEDFSAEAKAVFLSGSQTVTGEFECDREVLNWYHRAAVTSMRCNEHTGVLSDCPHRERLGYTGDGQLIAPATLLNLDAAALVGKWFQDVLDAQHRENGHVPHTAPFYNGGGGPGGWGGAIVFLPWTLYRHTGDLQILRRAWPQMLKWIDYLDAHSEDGIVVREEEGGWCLGDWCPPGGNASNLRIEPELVNTAFAVRMLDELAQMAEALGLPGERARLLRAADDRREALRRAFWRPETASFGAGCQGSTAMGLWVGAVPEQDRARALQRVVDELAAAGDHFDTGIFGTPVLLEVLSENGRADLALKLMTAEGYPSFAHMRDCGATTLYEYWEYENGSHNHQMFGAADEWLYAWVAGLAQSPDSAGWRRAVLRPGAVSGIQRARAAVETPFGRVSIAWSRTPDGLRWSFRKPALMNVEVRLPADGKGEVR